MSTSIHRVIDILQEQLMALESVAFVGVHPKRKDRIVLPAVLIDLSEIEPSTDAGTEETTVMCHWELRLVSSDRDEPQADWTRVIAVIDWLSQFDWPDVHIGKAHIKQAAPDHFSPEFHGHRVWLIEWLHEIRVGENIWEGEAPNIEAFILHYKECAPVTLYTDPGANDNNVNVSKNANKNTNKK